jgi:diguanylate cyclase (GGDEF)-like protein
MKPDNRRRSVLIIDDDAIIRLMASAALGDAGYDVVEAANAEAGLEFFCRRRADLVLLDVILPGMNGFEACARLRAHADGANVPIIVMTGLDDRQSIASAFDAGATDFITKPIVWDLLPYRVRYALRASAAFQEALRSRSLLSRSQSLANMGSWEWRPADDSLAWSDEMHRLVGTSPGPSDASAKSLLLEHVHPDDRDKVERALSDAMQQGLPYDIEFRAVKPGGELRWLVEQTSVERLANEAVVAVHGIRRDITKQTEANERIRSLALFDPLTGLANRSLFRKTVEHRLALGQAQGKKCAVVIVDIDRFQLINETLGPQSGDDVLKLVAHRLRDSLRKIDPKDTKRGPPDEESIARLAGDEFTVLLCDIDGPHQVNMVAQRIARSLGEPMVVAERDLIIRASIGIAMSPDDGKDTDALLRSASTAMHAAKQDLHHQVCFYDNAMGAAISHKASIETKLRHAIQHDELRVHYQAKVDVRTSLVVGAEALLRWMHPVRGLMGPLEFIPIAEESDLICQLTQWVTGEVCRQLGAWRAAGLPVRPVSINLDASSLQSQTLVRTVVASLEKNGLPPSAIEFEVTEGSLMHDLDQANETLEALRNIGVKLSLDDFGTGYSSLTYLKRFPIDVLKIDRSFVKDLPANTYDAALTTAIIAMGNSLQMDLIAEGVETWEQVDFLAERRCFVVQGFLFAKPLPADEFARLSESGASIRRPAGFAITDTSPQPCGADERTRFVDFPLAE